MSSDNINYAEASKDYLIVQLCRITRELRVRGVDVPSHLELLARMALTDDAMCGFLAVADLNEASTPELQLEAICASFVLQRSASTDPDLPAATGHHRASKSPMPLQTNTRQASLVSSLSSKGSQARIDAIAAALNHDQATGSSKVSATVAVDPVVLSPSSQGSQARYNAIKAALAPEDGIGDR